MEDLDLRIGEAQEPHKTPQDWTSWIACTFGLCSSLAPCHQKL